MKDKETAGKARARERTERKNNNNNNRGSQRAANEARRTHTGKPADSRSRIVSSIPIPTGRFPFSHPQVLSQLKRMARAMYSNPPSHGAKIVAEIVGNGAQHVIGF